MTRLFLQWELPRDVDFLCYTPSEFETKRNEISIVAEAVREGVVIDVAG